MSVSKYYLIESYQESLLHLWRISRSITVGEIVFEFGKDRLDKLLDEGHAGISTGKYIVSSKYIIEMKDILDGLYNNYLFLSRDEKLTLIGI